MYVTYISGFSDFVGGGEYSLFDLMTHLPAGVEPVLLVPAEGELSARAESEGIAWELLPMPRIGITSLAALWVWRKLLADIKPDLLHVNNSRPAFYAGLISKVIGVPVLFHCRVSATDYWMDSVLLRLVDMIVCNSQAVAARFAQARIPVRVVYNGVPLPAILPHTPALEDVGQLLLFIGRFSEVKQPHLALRIFEELATLFPNLHLALLGDDDPGEEEYAGSVRQAARDSVFASRIHVPGPVKDITAWLAKADVLVMPSQFEGFGRVLVEAMACGVPSVAFAVGGVPEVLEHDGQGMLVPAGDVPAMRDVVAELLRDDVLRQRMGESGRSHAQMFSCDHHVQAMMDVYQELLYG